MRERREGGRTPGEREHEEKSKRRKNTSAEREGSSRGSVEASRGGG